MAFTKINAAGIGTTETVTVDGLTVINDGSFGGNLSVGGTITYEDVTNVDSVGIITARAGVLVGSGITLSKDGDIFATGITTVSGNVKVGTGITLSPDGDVFATGVVTATSYYGDGSNLSNITSTTINNNAANRIITGSGTANTLNGNSDLLWNGSRLDIDTGGTEDALRIGSSSGADTFIRLGSINTTADTHAVLKYDVDDNYVSLLVSGESHGNGGILIANGGAVSLSAGTSPSAKLHIVDSAYHQLYVKGSSTVGGIRFGNSSNENGFIYYDNGPNMIFNVNNSEKLRITSGGKIGINIVDNTAADLQVRTGTNGAGVFRLGGSSNNAIGMDMTYSNSGSTSTIFKQNYLSTNAGALMQFDSGYITFRTGTSPTERLRLNSDGKFWLTGADMGGTTSFPSSSSGARIQIGAHTFAASDGVYDSNRLGMQINGNLSATIMLADVYNNASYPGYGYVMIQGPSTSDYVTYAICPDGPAKGNNLNFHIGEEQTNIHSGAAVRQVWFNASGNAYKRDNTTLWSTTSDERLKKNIVDNHKGLAEINQLRITSFEYRKEEEIDMSQFPLASIPRDVVIEGEEGPHTGVIAQEIESIFPECVRTSNKGAKTVDADAITWALVNAIKELSAKNDALEAEIAALKG